MCSLLVLAFAGRRIGHDARNRGELTGSGRWSSSQTPVNPGSSSAIGHHSGKLKRRPTRPTRRVRARPARARSRGRIRTPVSRSRAGRRLVTGLHRGQAPRDSRATGATRHRRTPGGPDAGILARRRRASPGPGSVHLPPKIPPAPKGDQRGRARPSMVPARPGPGSADRVHHVGVLARGMWGPPPAQSEDRGRVMRCEARAWGSSCWGFGRSSPCLQR